MPTQGFKDKLHAHTNQPRVRFIYDSIVYDELVLGISQIRRDKSISAGFATVELSNRHQDWNTFLYDSDSMAQSKLAELKLYFFGKEIRANTISFHDEDPDEIRDSDSGFVDAGFENGDEILVSNSLNNQNDGVYTIGTVAAGTIVLDAGDTLIAEAAGNNVVVRENVETFAIFKGTVENVAFRDASVTLTLRDKMAPMLMKELGSRESEVDLYSGGADNPADIVWYILTTATLGGLDDTEGVGNVDIDWASWGAWHTDCGTNNYQLKARFTGQTIRSALLKIAEITNSEIWVDSDAKFYFAPPHGIGDRDFATSNCSKIDISVSKDRLCNFVRCRYGYDPINDIWDGGYERSDAGSITNFGTIKHVEEDVHVWHNTLNSATSYADDKVDKYKFPLQIVNITAMMEGFLSVISDSATVTEALKQMSSQSVRIEELTSINLENGTIELKCLWT